jgi:DNA invertase Pin-like site-specific DNA recombinase
MDGNFVAYYRVSTDRQGASGLGLDAQRSAVMSYLNGGRWKLVAEFTEVESGKNSDRAQLRAAQAACKKHKARLVIAKLDRLSRNVAFVANLLEAGTDFVAVDNPHVNKPMVQMMPCSPRWSATRYRSAPRRPWRPPRQRGPSLATLAWPRPVLG